MSELILADTLSTLPDRRVSDRRIEKEDMANRHNERAPRNRRTSPAIGEHAILDAHRLRQELIDMHGSVALAADNAAADALTIVELRSVNAELLAALQNIVDHIGIVQARAAIAKAGAV